LTTIPFCGKIAWGLGKIPNWGKRFGYVRRGYFEIAKMMQNRVLEKIMHIRKGHKIQLLPNNKQRTCFNRWAGAYRWAYNYGLERREAEYKSTGKSLGAYALKKEITKLKYTEEYSWLQDISKSVPRVALMHLEKAYKNFFCRCKNGEKGKGFPKFKSKKHSKMVFHIEPEQIRLDNENKRVRLPKIGWIRMAQAPRFSGKLIKTVAVSERAGKWYVSFNYEIEVEPVETQNGPVGIDLGVKTLATLSDGTTYENPRVFQCYQQLLARAQRQLTRKQRGSKRWQRGRLRVQRIHKRIQSIRNDAIHKSTSEIASQYGLVALEDLNIRGMVKNRCLAKSVSDAAMSEFCRQIQYKMLWAGGETIVIDRWFPSSKLCSKCGCINSNLILADRIWTCECGAIHDRDQNAAINILTEALNPGDSDGSARGGKGAIRLPMKREWGNKISPQSVK